MVSRPEIVTYKSNVAVVFLVNLSLGLFLQAQRLAAKLRLVLVTGSLSGVLSGMSRSPCEEKPFLNEVLSDVYLSH